MIVAIGDESATGFNRKSEPFSVPGNYSALWNSLSILSDNTVVAVTTTNMYSGSASEVWMIKGHVIPEIYASPFPEDDDAIFVCLDAKNKSAESITLGAAGWPACYPYPYWIHCRTDQ